MIDAIQKLLPTLVNESDITIAKLAIENNDVSLLPLHLLNKINFGKVLTPRQARLILLQNELLDEIETMLASDKAMQIWWEYSLEIIRDSEHIINAANALGLTSEQLDQMFIDGSKL